MLFYIQLAQLCMKKRFTCANWPVRIDSDLLVGRIAHAMRHVILYDKLCVGVAHFRKTLVLTEQMRI